MAFGVKDKKDYIKDAKSLLKHTIKFRNKLGYSKKDMRTRKIYNKKIKMIRKELKKVNL